MQKIIHFGVFLKTGKNGIIHIYTIINASIMDRIMFSENTCKNE